MSDVVLKQKSVEALRRWLKDCSEAPCDRDPLVYFTIPLIWREAAIDWAASCRNLARTIAALRAQTDNGWRAYICAQDVPEGVEFDDQVQFLTYDPTRASTQTPTFEAKGRTFTYDKTIKTMQIVDHVQRVEKGHGYMFRLDADDLVHPAVVAYIRSDNNGIGYLVERGFMWNGAQSFAHLRPSKGQPGLRQSLVESLQARGLAPKEPYGPLPFNHQSGSCAAIRFDFRPDQPLAKHWPPNFHHRQFGAYFDAAGVLLPRIPFGAMIYLMGQSTNMHVVRGKDDRKKRYARRHRCSAKEIAAIRTDFGATLDI